jgi:hypothetical protein
VCKKCFSNSGSNDLDNKDDVDSGDELDGKKIDNEEVLEPSALSANLKIKLVLLAKELQRNRDRITNLHITSDSSL